ncbi:MAG: triple tyrosine motif-containing protein [Clostridiaceae bacterium]
MNEVKINIQMKSYENAMYSMFVEIIETPDKNLLYKFIVGYDGKWETLRGYSKEKQLIWKTKETGEYTIMIQAKHEDSTKALDYVTRESFIVDSAFLNCNDSELQINGGKIEPVEIESFICLTPDLIVGNELIFKVEVKNKDSIVLYKFFKIDSQGRHILLEDYSTKSMVSYKEDKVGNYRIVCYARDINSLEEKHDQAVINYSVKPYKKINILGFTTDISTLSGVNKKINLKAVATGGNELTYRFVIEGEETVDSSYIKSNNFDWTPKKSGDYKFILYVKDKFFPGEYEEKRELLHTIKDDVSENVEIKNIVLSSDDYVLINDKINIKVFAKGGVNLRYAFVVSKEGKIIDKISYGTCNYVNFVPEDKGIYEINVMAKDKYSEKEYDAHSVKYINVNSFVPANIDHILIEKKDIYLVNEEMNFRIIIRDTKNSIIKYKVKINNKEIEENKYVSEKEFKFLPKIEGMYTITVYCKNKDSDNDYDSKKEININVVESYPIANTRLICDKTDIKNGDLVSFNLESNGGKNLMYEFYIMGKNEWILKQEYSPRNYFSYIPHEIGEYEVLALVKSEKSSKSYESFTVLKILVL